MDRVIYNKSKVIQLFCRALVVLFSLFVAFPCAAAEKSYQEAVKGNFVYNISKFIRQPDSKSSIYLCIYEDSHFFRVLEQIHKSDDSLYANHIKLRIIEPDKHIDDCDMVFIHQKNIPRLQDFLRLTEDKKILTVSDIKGFIQEGGMIELVTVSDKIRLQVNYEEVRNHGVKISSRLLNLTEIVNRQERTGE